MTCLDCLKGLQNICSMCKMRGCKNSLQICCVNMQMYVLLSSPCSALTVALMMCMKLTWNLVPILLHCPHIDKALLTKILYEKKWKNCCDLGVSDQATVHMPALYCLYINLMDPYAFVSIIIS